MGEHGEHQEMKDRKRKAGELAARIQKLEGDLKEAREDLHNACESINCPPWTDDPQANGPNS